jgi:hypothetical protein
MPIRDFEEPGMVGQNIRGELLSSASSADTSIGTTRAHAATDAVKSRSNGRVA